MEYMRLTDYNVSNFQDKTISYYELDEKRLTRRLLIIFKDNSIAFSDNIIEVTENLEMGVATILNDERYPCMTVEEINNDDQEGYEYNLFAELLTKDEFETIWNKRATPIINIIRNKK